VSAPKAFISYSWDCEEHKAWVKALASKLRDQGVDAMLDRWALVLGDSLTQFMETAIRESDFVLIVLTPQYKEKSDGRTGGAGYEGEIMTSEVFIGKDRRKFIPVLRSGTWEGSSPSWLLGKFGVDLRGDPYNDEQYQDLLHTLHGIREQAPRVGAFAHGGFTIQGTAYASVEPSKPALPHSSESQIDQLAPVPIKILGIIASEVGTPRNDGTRGSALYAVPFQLSRGPSPEWAHHFVEVWRSPPSYTTRHRPGIARVEGDRIILDGTTVEEVAQYHRDTLKVVIAEVNRDIEARERYRQQEAQREAERLSKHREAVEEAAKKIKFDD
jgi:hypothetical protein